MPEVLYKVLGPRGEAVKGGSGSWHLPRDARPGKWMPRIDDIKPCKRGYHLTAIEDLLRWIDRDDAVVWVAEGRGERVDHDGKVVFGQARLVSRTAWSPVVARLFAADCAEHVLPIWEGQFPEDRRPRDTIDVVRRFARGEATRDELATASAAAAYAAYAAASRASADAAYAAAAYATAAAAYAADAAAAEREWQHARLTVYLNGDAS